MFYIIYNHCCDKKFFKETKCENFYSKLNSAYRSLDFICKINFLIAWSVFILILIVLKTFSHDAMYYICPMLTGDR